MVAAPATGMRKAGIQPTAPDAPTSAAPAAACRNDRRENP